MTSALISSHCVLHFAGPRARKPKKPSTSSSAAGGGGGGGGVEKGEAYWNTPPDLGIFGSCRNHHSSDLIAHFRGVSFIGSA